MSSELDSLKDFSQRLSDNQQYAMKIVDAIGHLVQDDRLEIEEAKNLLLLVSIGRRVTNQGGRIAEKIVEKEG